MRFLCLVLLASSSISRVSGMQASSAKDLRRTKQMPDGDANGEDPNDTEPWKIPDSMEDSTTRSLPDAAAQLNANGDVTNAEVRRHATSDDENVFVEMDANGVIDAATGKANISVRLMIRKVFQPR
jgi:hypothetical protein